VRSYLSAFTLLLIAASASVGQNVTSTVKGTLLDQTGAAIPGAKCVLINPATNAVSQITSAADGSFVFLQVAVGSYTLSVEAAGFKTYNRQDVEVTANEFHSTGSIILELGAAADQITVTEQSLPVQVSSGERSDLVSGEQLSDVAVKGRDFVSYLMTVPGIIDTNSESRDSFTRNALSGIHINGGRDTSALMVIDGMPSMDSGNNGTPQQPNMDAIQEVKVLASNYQAEFGRNSGGQVIVVSKTGSNQLHGSAYDYYRHESLNANSWINNKTDTQKQPYRYRMSGYSIGGPILIPKHTNLTKNKLFFFFSQEFVGSIVNYTPQLVTTPSALERTGDFSQSYDVNGKLIAIKDPLNNGAAFPGNVIPSNRFNSIGKSILNFYPLPNYVDPQPQNKYQYNYRSLFAGGWPRRQELGRIDANFWSNVQVYYRVMDDYDVRNIPWGAAGWPAGSVNYLLTPISWDRPSRMQTGHITHTISPTLVNEITVNRGVNNVFVSPVDPSLLQRSRLGDLPQLYPDTQAGTNWLPGITFGGTPAHTINSTLSNSLPEMLPNKAYVFTDNISKVWGAHQLKAGVYTERNVKVQPGGSNYRGTYNFGTNANNPNNSGDGFSNALLGNFNTYTEDSSSPIGRYRFWNVEWYLQDNWRVTRRLTLDLGLRFYHIPPTEDLHNNVSAMVPSEYVRANAPVLYTPVRNSANQRVAMNPLTGELVSVNLIGQFVPGTGNPVNGMEIGGQNGFPAGLYRSSWLGLGPRFGFAYDVFGKGKTALRGGFGIFKDRVQGNLIYNAEANPPVTWSPTLNFGSIDTLLQTPGVTGPSALTEMYGFNPTPTIMNYSIGVQHQLRNTVLDVSYIGSLARHISLAKNINPIPMYAHFNPAYKDPSQTNNTALPDNFLRPYYGYGNITTYQFMGTSNYHSMQVSLRRRFTGGLQFGMSYTFSKALGVASGDTEAVSPYLPPRSRDYGPLNFDRRQSLVVNYTYNVPSIGNRFGVAPAKWILNNWQLSGISTFQSGSPFTPGFTTTNSQDISGSTEAARIDVIGDPTVGAAPGTFFNTAAFARPQQGTLGNAGANVLYRPGINNWDISVGKRFKFSEKSTLLIRTELYNAWNHTQYNALYTTARFQGPDQVDINFGTPSGTRNPRNIQISARLVF
jgi:hypothetical protein